MDVHHDPAPEDRIHSSHSSDTLTPTFSIWSHTLANHPNDHHQTAPKEYHSQIYHPKLNGVYLFLLFFTIHCIHVHLQGRYVTKTGMSFHPIVLLIQSHNKAQMTGPLMSHVSSLELADFLYRCNQMSEDDVNSLLDIINALLVLHDGQAPFCHYTDMQDIIDAATVGKASWDHFTLNYN